MVRLKYRNFSLPKHMSCLDCVPSVKYIIVAITAISNYWKLSGPTVLLYLWILCGSGVQHIVTLMAFVVFESSAGRP